MENPVTGKRHHNQGLNVVVKILFFSSIREQLNTEELQLSLPSGAMTIIDFTHHLISENDREWNILLEDNVVTALNQRVVNASELLQDGDELAYFPPMTGG